MIIKGQINDIIFRNDENGYTVINFDINSTFIVAVGIFPFANVGDMYELEGDYKVNPKFGEQFVVEHANYIKPTDIDSIKKYLASGLFPGIGEKIAKAIVRKFGAETLSILEDNPYRLTEVRGIKEKRAKDIIAAYAEHVKARDAILFLQKYDISTGVAMKIYKEYEADTISIVSKNPYKLIEDIEGIGFFRADKFAESLGITKDSNFRLEASLLHVLREASSKNGHTFLPERDLIREASKLSSINDEDRYLEILQHADKIKKIIIDDEVGYSLSYIFYTENSIATNLINLKNFSINLDLNADAEIENYQQSNYIALDIDQKDAIKKALSEGIIIITGGPGTGKTMITKCLVDILFQRNLKIALAAPTGRAAKKISQATNKDAQTLHRLLGITSRNYEDREVTLLDYDVIIVDEISMADIFIFNTLLKSIRSGSRLILIGDKDQLPSVACGNILADMIKSDMFCTVYLNKIYRQAKESMIVINAHRINNSEMPIVKNTGDFFIDNKSDAFEIRKSIISMVARRIPKFINVNPRDIQVLAPMKKGIVGVEELNKAIQQRLNPYGKEISHRNMVFRVGDKVMQTVNNYTIEWHRFNESGTGVFNGDIGYILDIINQTVKVEFEDNKQVTYQLNELEELTTAYCISIHKSQGCEFPAVIVAVSGGSYAILTKNLLYTAITRAKDMVVLVGDEKNIERMIKNKYMIERFSLLRHLLLENSKRLMMLKGIK